MSFTFAVRKLFSESNQWGAQTDKKAKEKILCADKSFIRAFPSEVTKVAVINVDTAGRELLLSGQKGICVQWR
jgi:hypothetical protein